MYWWRVREHRGGNCIREAFYRSTETPLRLLGRRQAVCGHQGACFPVRNAVTLLTCLMACSLAFSRPTHTFSWIAYTHPSLTSKREEMMPCGGHLTGRHGNPREWARHLMVGCFDSPVSPLNASAWEAALLEMPIMTQGEKKMKLPSHAGSWVWSKLQTKPQQPSYLEDTRSVLK